MTATESIPGESAPTPPGRLCYRCDEFVRMTAEDSARWPNAWTICAVCRVKLDIEAGFVGATADQTHVTKMP